MLLNDPKLEFVPCWPMTANGMELPRRIGRKEEGVDGISQINNDFPKDLFKKMRIKNMLYFIVVVSSGTGRDAEQEGQRTTGRNTEISHTLTTPF